jgi:oxaloacetate decarboxylase alpha subunit
VLASQALLHVLSASRWTTIVDELRALVAGRYGTPPGPVDRTVKRVVELQSDGGPPEERPLELAELRADAEGLAASEEELLLIGLFGPDAEPLLQTIRGRASREDSLAAGGVDQSRQERIREIVRIVQESGVGEITIEDDDLRVTVRRTDETPAVPVPVSPLSVAEPEEAPLPPPVDEVVRVESPMVGTFYRAPEPGAAPFVEVGDPVATGQTLCILEAMKLMNEVKSELEARVRAIHVENAQPVEFGQLLFELEPINGRPLDAV